GLGLAELEKDSLGQVALPRAEGALVDHRVDMVQMPVLVLRFVLDRDLLGAEPVLLHVGRDDPHARQPERADGRVDGLEIGAGVDERPERHIATDAAGAIEVGDLHAGTTGESWGPTRCTGPPTLWSTTGGGVCLAGEAGPGDNRGHGARLAPQRSRPVP